MIRELRWRLRRWFWNHLATFKFDHNRPTPVPVPAPDRPITLVPVDSLYRRIPLHRALAADRIPDDERQITKQVFARIQAALYHLVSPQQRGLDPVDADPRVALERAYTAAHRRRFRPPDRPSAVDDLDLGMLAVASPFACYAAANDDGTFGWDLGRLNDFEHHSGVRPIGAVVTFELMAGDGRLRATRIDCDAGSCTPSDPDWRLACRLAMSAASTHLSLVRHFGWIHLAGGGPLAVVTRNELPQDHPVRRLVWPHVYATQYSNDVITLDQLTDRGDFESIFSLTHRGVNGLIDASIEEFDFGVVDPDVDVALRKLERVESPSLTNRRQHHAVFLAHAQRYLERYYPDDEQLAADAAVQSWRGALARRLRGIDRVAGEPVTVNGIARLVAAIIQLAVVEHEILGSGMWDYQLWSDVMPARVPMSGGCRPPLDVYQRLVNANFNLNVHRTALLDDFSALALDARGADAFRAFQTDLLELQTSLDASPSAPWRMEPKRLKANINA
jgi:arachidonate 15-lipoxygenase